MMNTKDVQSIFACQIFCTNILYRMFLKFQISASQPAIILNYRRYSELYFQGFIIGGPTK